jgi:alanine racemase
VSRPSLIDVDRDAIRANVAAVAAWVAPAQVCVVVKADGYGHGAVDAAGAALAGGASWLAVALAAEGAELRRLGVDAPIMLLSEPTHAELRVAAEHDLTPTLYTLDGVCSAASINPGWAVQVKVDTGMHRVGVAPADAVELVRSALAAGLRLVGTFTHLALADTPERPENQIQVDRYESVLADLDSAGIDPGLRHAANSAAALHLCPTRFDLVRIGLAAYGVPPSLHPSPIPLRPALRLRSRVSFINHVPVGEGVSYGWHHVANRPMRIAVVPLGYADGVPRNLGLRGAEVLLGGRRRPIVGAVTMDQLMVDVTDADTVSIGDEVVLLGDQGEERITASEWADRLGTIPYEVLVGFGARVPRTYPD